MNIGELARATGTKTETIRYYERIGLLPTPPRTAGNYRAYSTVHAGRLAFTRRARGLGFSIDQIRALLDLPIRKTGRAKRLTPLPGSIWPTWSGSWRLSPPCDENWIR